MRTPSLKAIKTFQIAAKHSSFAVAADELCITPSAVSHQIKTLETQLGLPLFSRGARALALTDAGARYLEQIDDLFMRLESVTEQLRARYGRNSVRLHVPAYFASEMLLPRLSEFSQLHDGIDLRIDTSGRRTAAQHVAEADISVVVGTGPWNGLVAHPLFAQTMVPACSPELLAEKPGAALRGSQRAHPAGARSAARRLGPLGERRRHEGRCGQRRSCASTPCPRQRAPPRRR